MGKQLEQRIYLQIKIRVYIEREKEGFIIGVLS